MNKKNILILSFVALILTLIFAGTFCIYHFDHLPSPMTILSLISIYLSFDYLLLLITYCFKKFMKKEKLGLKKIIGLILPIISLLLILLFSIIINYEYLIWYSFSSPFYVNVIVRSLEFLLPAIILSLISFFLIKKPKKK